MDGKALAGRIREEVATEVAELGQLGLATVLVGDDEASKIYIRLKHRAAEKAGIRPVDIRLSEDVSEEEVVSVVEELNADNSVDGLLVQLPLPDHIAEGRVIRAIDPVKDVDGIHPLNAGQLYLGRPTLVGATPLGILRLLDEYGIALKGANAVVVGRSDIVGKPAAHLLLQRHATVTICHSRTRALAEITRRAEVLVVAVGRDRMVKPDWVAPGATVVDVGMNRSEEGLFGDVDPAVMEVAGHMTPVPGGVGPMTIAMLLRNTVLAARFRRGSLAFPRA
jgi:methylenetetrahydrofolate dehydrogenase (NADP+) / methenyltetrahydrofolate cyclohydrolase